MKNEKKNNKLKITLLTLLIILAIGITITNVFMFIKNKKNLENIKNNPNIPKYYLNIQKDDKKDCKDQICNIILKVNNLKNLNYDSDISAKEFDSTETNIPLEEIEKKLNINILETDNQKNKDIAISRLEKVDNKVGSGDFYIRDAFNIKNKSKKKTTVNVAMQFITKYSEKYQNGLTLFLGPNELITTTYIDNLDTFVYFWYSKPELKNNEIVPQMIVTFIYDDIAYTIEGNNISRNMMIELLESLK